MELDNREVLDSEAGSLERLEAAATLLEKTVALLEQGRAALAGDVQKIVATVEQNNEGSRREQELEQKLMAAEEEIAELRAQAAQREVKTSAARKTLPAATVQLLSKQGLEDLDRVEAGSLDAALAGLSLEQRIAVKAQLLRAGSLR
ncbi:MAG TPA: hypothetical protein VM554_10400 [Acidisarcina sp.]|nr:hypothetical protein [Acidisarcina sp.]